ncbi:hypothetical protein O7626_38495 [Micromonospora sp. WMMD1102]|uniref:hypothetical protein n=1 Tax=Micromonospora sp. WMMD1102 TaxID=3016105 RepID=UPI002415600D|nr:hypothetical protein [Micromonospora sp. WMMD1102]MDG4791718.1 hypothetical protein [Micromonospora sp. WMMD1102]
MAPDRKSTRRDATLSPARWSPPGIGSVLRWLLVGTLSALAFGFLLLRAPASSCPAPQSGAAADRATATPDPAGAADDQPAATGEAAGPTPSGGPAGGTTSASPPGAGPSPGGGPAGRPGAAPGGPGLPTGSAVPVPAGTVGVPIRLAEPAALTVARPGARVDLLAAPGGDPAGRVPKPTVLATRVLVLDVLGPGQTDGAASAIYLALRPEQAHRAVGMPESTRFAIVVRS